MGYKEKKDKNLIEESIIIEDMDSIYQEDSYERVLGDKHTQSNYNYQNTMPASPGIRP